MIRCFNHGKMSSMVCNHKGCTHRTLCSDCIVTHPKNHVASILPLRDFDPNSYTVPRTIAKVFSGFNQIGFKSSQIKNEYVIKSLDINQRNKKI